MTEPQQPNPWRFLGLGAELAAVVFALVLLGLWADRRWDTSPWLTLSGALFGIAGGLYNLVRVTLRSMK